VSVRQVAGCSVLALMVFARVNCGAQGQQPATEPPTLRVTSNLVFLDIEVLDKWGEPVVKGLSKDDFTITEDQKPQRIFSFEAPQEHAAAAKAQDDMLEGKSALTIYVLDLLNSRPEDFAFIRTSLRNYLYAQPKELREPSELMVVGNRSLEMLQGFTRDREELMDALKHLPPTLPYKQMNVNFMAERFAQSIEALQEIALQNKGVPGRKNVIWIGDGPPTVDRSQLVGSGAELVDRYMHLTTNMLVDSRVTVFAISPYLRAEGRSMATIQGLDNGMNGNPFVGDVNFGIIASGTGGQLYFNRNNVDAEIKRAATLGANYYTLTYQPENLDPDGKLRRVKVTLRDPNLHAVTKIGYFAPEKTMNLNPREMSMVNSIDAARAGIPFTAMDVKISGIVRHSDSHSMDFMVDLKSKALGWKPTADGKSVTNLTVVVASLNSRREILASKVDRATLAAPTQDPAKLAQEVIRFPLSVRVPRRTQSVRVVMQTEDAGRVGTADLDMKTIEAAPEAPAPGEPSAPNQTPSLTERN